MRKYTLLLLLIITSFINAQDFSKKNSRFIHLKNGEKIPLYKVMSTKKNVFTYKKSEVTGIEKISADKIDMVVDPVTLSYKNVTVRNFDLYTWRYIKVGKKLVFVADIETGYCNAYVDPSIGSLYGFYVKRENENTATLIHDPGSFGKKIKKTGKIYFNDCDEVITNIKKSKVQNKFHQVFNKLAELVSLYNKNCAINDNN